jgi:potassium channel LctB
MIKKIHRKHMDRFKRMERFLYDKPLHKVPAFAGTAIILLLLLPSISKGNDWGSYLSFLIVLFLSIYFLFFLVFILRHSLKSLFKAQNLWRLLVSYVLFIIAVLLLFSLGYLSIEKMHRGYITYGKCSDHFEVIQIERDSQKATDYFYFSTITLFTVGYGDICPMGWSKFLSMFNAFIGNFISVILMVLVITAYVNRGTKRR